MITVDEEKFNCTETFCNFFSIFQNLETLTLTVSHDNKDDEDYTQTSWFREDHKQDLPNLDLSETLKSHSSQTLRSLSIRGLDEFREKKKSEVEKSAITIRVMSIIPEFQALKYSDFEIQCIAFLLQRSPSKVMVLPPSLSVLKIPHNTYGYMRTREDILIDLLKKFILPTAFKTIRIMMHMEDFDSEERYSEGDEDDDDDETRFLLKETAEMYGVVLELY